MTIARIDENKWCRCGKCGHKLFKTDINDLSDKNVGMAADVLKIEIKCHSCKVINVLMGGGSYESR